nr:DUF2285 domain-containing protein [uncultured Cupriavidus sp.]
MATRSSAHRFPTAAYLYLLHQDSAALAWEYLRRHPDYQQDWLRSRDSAEAARRWGLRLLEDPALDGRDAHPIWFPDHDAVMQLYADADPPPDAHTFSIWSIPGDKQLIHDGKRLVLVARWPGNCVRMALAPDLEDGMAYCHAVRASAMSNTRYRVAAAEQSKVTVTRAAASSAVARPRPTPTALLELHTLQALDAILAGASLRQVAEGLFGVDVVAAGWHADSGLRSRVRRLVRRGQKLMRGGYRGMVA